MKGLRALRGLFEGGLVLREIRRLRGEIVLLYGALDRIASALELRNAHEYPSRTPAEDSRPGVEVAYIDSAHQELLMDIELRLTAARGMAPTEEELLAEFERRMGTPAED